MKTRWTADLHGEDAKAISVVEGNFREKCVDVESKKRRRILTKLRGGTTELREQTGSWREQPREERICTLYSVPEIVDLEHFLLRCRFFSDEQKALLVQKQTRWC